MKKLFYFLFSLPMAFAAASCADTVADEAVVSPSDGVRADEADAVGAVDLSALEMANCYIVQTPGSYMFKADNQFNLGEGLPVPPQMNPVSARLLWQTEAGLITDVELVRGEDWPFIRFNVAKAEGNAVIAALGEDGEIQWSWHIWMPRDKVTAVEMSTGYEVMSMNLGALNNTPGDAASYGMLYQWGRKDPFPAAATLTGTTATVGAPIFDIDGNEVRITNSSWYSDDDNTIAYSIANPTVCLSNYAHYATSVDWLVDSDDSLWGNPNGHDYEGDDKFPSSGRKTCYDPSPAGWRVAPADAFRDFTINGGYCWNIDDFMIQDYNRDGNYDIDDFVYGWHFFVKGNDALYFPAAARFDGSYAMLMGSMSGLWGNYWSNAPFVSAVTDKTGQAFCCLSFSVKDQMGNDMVTVSPAAGGSRADAYSVRCVRDTESSAGDSGVKVVRPD